MRIYEANTAINIGEFHAEPGDLVMLRRGHERPIVQHRELSLSLYPLIADAIASGQLMLLSDGASARLSRSPRRPPREHARPATRLLRFPLGAPGLVPSPAIVPSIDEFLPPACPDRSALTDQ